MAVVFAPAPTVDFDNDSNNAGSIAASNELTADEYEELAPGKVIPATKTVMILLSGPTTGSVTHSSTLPANVLIVATTVGTVLALPKTWTLANGIQRTIEMSRTYVFQVFVTLTLSCFSLQTVRAAETGKTSPLRSSVSELKPIDIKAHVAQVRRALGKREIRIEKSEAFYFRNGRYLSLPYDIRREGYALYVNNVEIFRHPTVPRWFQTDLPPLPKAITATSSWADVEKIRVGKTPWHILYVRWMSSNTTPDERGQKLSANPKQLPFVKTVEWVPQPQYGKGLRLLRVTSKRGDVREFFTSWWDPKKKEKAFSPPVIDYRTRPHDLSPFRESEILKNLEGRFASQQKVLTMGELAFIQDTPAPGGHIRIRRDNRKWRDIVDVVAILNSSASKKLKTQEVYSRLFGRFPFKPGYHPSGPHWERVKQLVREFKPHPQLDRRVAELKIRGKLPDWKRPPEPQAQTIPANLKDDPRLTPQGTVREALKALEAKQYQKYIDDLTVYRGEKSTAERFRKGENTPLMIIALRNIQGKKPVIDDIDDDMAYFIVDAPKLRNLPGHLEHHFYKKLPLRRVGPLWKVGY